MLTNVAGVGAYPDYLTRAHARATISHAITEARVSPETNADLFGSALVGLPQHNVTALV